MITATLEYVGIEAKRVPEEELNFQRAPKSGETILLGSNSFTVISTKFVIRAGSNQTDMVLLVR